MSATFCYENPDARALVQAAAADAQQQRNQGAQQEHEHIEASWRERALNAEETLTRTQQTVFTQRKRIGELMGQLRDIEQTAPSDSAPALRTENASLRRRLDQVTQEHSSLQERLEGARSNLRFAERRIADLEAQLLEKDQS
ncbi:hypothetical protein J7I98_08210 [Streptomyces sp. ISL-98]|uniref:hypothetical protein n=1 Tax=Streptomyces sp. ISL-98 TaxID=2819192 RepID=UPI001BE5A428|nr:hypothetical protein [Streptomyces sp. ISL-98]MBT2505883.1 hypothetical protein [Streptomyces sp. ISL-98]